MWRREIKKDTLSCWIYLGVVVFAVSLILGMLNSVGVLVVVFVDYYDESNTKAGWIGSIPYFLDGCSFPVVVYLRRHFGFRPIVVCTSLLIALAFFSTSFMPNLDLIFLTFAIPFGVGNGLFDCLTIISLREYFDKYLGLATGIRFAPNGVGVMLYTYILPICFDAIGWKTTFIALSFLLGLACFACSLVYHRPPDLVKEQDHENEQEITIKTVTKTETSYGFLRNRRFLLILIGSVPFVFVVLSPSIFMMQHAKGLGYPISKFKWLLVVYGLASLLGRLSISVIGDIALKRKKLSLVSAVAVVFFGIGNGLCSFTQSLPLMISCMGIIGFFEGMYWANLPLMNLEVTYGAQTNEAYALMMLVTGIGMLAGPPTSGWIFDVFGDFRYVLYLVSACAITGGFIMGIGSCLTSQKNGRSENNQDQRNSVCSRTIGLGYDKLLSVRTDLKEKQLIVMVHYETAV